MTLEQLSARSDAIDECIDILIDTFFESDYENTYVSQMYDTLRDRYRKLRDSAWRKFELETREMSKQA